MKKLGLALLFICIGVFGTLFFYSPRVKLLDNSKHHMPYYYIELLSGDSVKGVNIYLVASGEKGDLWPYSGLLKPVPRNEFDKAAFLKKFH